MSTFEEDARKASEAFREMMKVSGISVENFAKGLSRISKALPSIKQCIKLTKKE